MNNKETRVINKGWERESWLREPAWEKRARVGNPRRWCLVMAAVATGTRGNRCGVAGWRSGCDLVSAPTWTGKMKPAVIENQSRALRDRRQWCWTDCSGNGWRRWRKKQRGEVIWEVDRSWAEELGWWHVGGEAVDGRARVGTTRTRVGDGDGWWWWNCDGIDLGKLEFDLNIELEVN